MVNQATALMETIETADKPAAFPDYPPRDDMQNHTYLHRPTLFAALREHLGDKETTLVYGECPVRAEPEQPRRQAHPRYGGGV